MSPKVLNANGLLTAFQAGTPTDDEVLVARLVAVALSDPDTTLACGGGLTLGVRTGKINTGSSAGGYTTLALAKAYQYLVTDEATAQTLSSFRVTAFSIVNRKLTATVELALRSPSRTLSFTLATP